MRDPLARGDFPRIAYRLGRAAATGVLTIDAPRVRREVLILRRGHVITTEQDLDGRHAALRLGRIAQLEGATWAFDGGTAAYPPGGAGRPVSLAAWARSHLEAQVDAARAERLVTELAGVRISVRADHAPEPVDEVDRRMLDAMATPRRIDQIAATARTPRFRLLAFLHFLRTVGALTLIGVVVEDASDSRTSALRLLGLDGDTSREAVKRAYRRVARALHPDLQPGISTERRRELESKLAEVTAAVQSLL